MRKLISAKVEIVLNESHELVNENNDFIKLTQPFDGTTSGIKPITEQRQLNVRGMSLEEETKMCELVEVHDIMTK